MKLCYISYIINLRESTGWTPLSNIEKAKGTESDLVTDSDTSSSLVNK